MRVTRRELIEARLNDVEQCVCESPPQVQPSNYGNSLRNYMKGNFEASGIAVWSDALQTAESFGQGMLHRSSLNSYGEVDRMNEIIKVTLLCEGLNPSRILLVVRGQVVVRDLTAIRIVKLIRDRKQVYDTRILHPGLPKPLPTL